jgi:uncharacterized membrane protein YdbT with pleckstrin-like domain
VRPTTAPARTDGIDRYLLPYEMHVLTLRQHPAVLLPPLAVAVGGLLAAIATSAIRLSAKAPQIVVFILTVFLIVRFAMAVVNYIVLRIVITHKRFLLISGINRRKVRVTPMPKLKEITFQRSLGGRLLGYGTFSIESDGKPQSVIDYIPYPEQIYLEISAILFPHRGAQDEDDESADEGADES